MCLSDYTIIIYNMQGLSYREFLNIKTGNDFQALDLEEILQNHMKHAFAICDRVNVKKL